MTSADVSVLIPAYNRADYIKEAIRSALCQTLSPREIIVVDDGSTDHTAEVVQSIVDPRVRLIQQENRGVSAALNTAWGAARGQYLAMLGSDDLWEPNLLEELVPTLDSHPDIGVVYARAQAIDSRGHPLPQILGAPEKFPGETLKSLLYGDFVCGIATVFRRSCIERVGGFDESLVANEDWDLWIRLAEVCRFAYKDKILAHYRMHPSSLTGGKSPHFDRVITNRVRVIERYYARPDVPPEARVVKALAIRNVNQDVAVRYIAAGRLRDAWPYIQRTLVIGPHPLLNALRLSGVVIFDLYLSKTHWGTHLVDGLVRLRRRLTVAWRAT